MEKSESDSVSKAEEERAEKKISTEERVPAQNSARYEQLMIRYICEDNFQAFASTFKSVNASKISKEAEDETDCASEAVRFVHLACKLDSVNCAVSILGGGLGFHVPVDSSDENGKTALHHAAYGHSISCIRFLLGKRARTDIKSKDGQLPLDLALCSKRVQVGWNISNSVTELLQLLKDTDMKIVKLLASNTKDVAQIAYRKAMQADIVAFAILLCVSSSNILSATVISEGNPPLHATMFDHVLKKVLSRSKIEIPDTLDANGNAVSQITLIKDKYLVDALELLLSLGGSAYASDFPLIQATRAGDELLVKMFLRSNLDPNEADHEGNRAIHYCLNAGFSKQNFNILSLLLKYGASISAKNSSGLTSIHVAAAHGNFQGLQKLLERDSVSVDIVTDRLETPLFFSAKSNHLECARLLLVYGADPEPFNLRKQRPIDLAWSQEMRDLLTNASSKLDNSTKQIPSGSNHSSIQMQDQLSERSNLAACKKKEICKYYQSAQGCYRGDKCYYSHGQGELRRVPSSDLNSDSHVSTEKELQRKVFVGGLPPTVDSDYLKEFFANNFGPVVDAIVLGDQPGEKLQSRGFGFVTFKDPESVVSAVKARFVTIYGKKVEVKGAIPKSVFQNMEFPKGTPSMAQDNEKENIESQDTDQSIWDHKENPAWLEKFKLWLPGFLEEAIKRMKEGEWYPLSSLKGDFRATCGMELDHVSLGYLKLSDFLRSMPGLCRVKIVPVANGPATHMVLYPRRKVVRRPFEPAPANVSSLELPKETLDVTNYSQKNSESMPKSNIHGIYRQEQLSSVEHLALPKASVSQLTDRFSSFDVNPYKDPEKTSSDRQQPMYWRPPVSPLHPHMQNSCLNFLNREKSFLTPWAYQKPVCYTPVRASGQFLGNNKHEDSPSPESVLSAQRSVSSSSNQSLGSESPSSSQRSSAKDSCTPEQVVGSKNNEPKCIVCARRNATWLAVPCSHRVLCTQCCTALKASQLLLPCFVCGDPVTGYVALH